MTEMSPEKPVILFDGVCNLCNSSVNFVIDRDPQGTIYFAPLQSEYARKLLEKHQIGMELNTIVLLEDGKVYDRSTAALRIARLLNGPWPLLYASIVIPRFIRDGVYRWIARNRYRWFGKTQACRVPTPELQARFLA
ncbi:MAG: thiol-disulfide oxidoreductase DCC family protein [Deltaproteobacteria bacterium]|nr:thiol-disulfide oxidoreductase DCC family protein [Deltaproteobacteria bacterium]MBT6432761.1 thiol-disulfide oxidoreductase DCC family protein [Deltaproteobacteria bacterium]